MRNTNNPVLRSLSKQQGGYAQFGPGIAGATQAGYEHPGQLDPSVGQYQPTQVSRPMTIDDVVTKTGMTLGVLTLVAVAAFFVTLSSPGLASPMLFIGAFGGLALVLVATLGRRQDNPALVLSYAGLEGMFLGAFSAMFAATTGGGALSLIGQAIAGTIGVFFGMLVVYKTGAIRVTPKFTRMVVAALFGVLALMIVNLVTAMFGVGGGSGLGLRDGSATAIIFSLVCIGIAAFSFLIDFDAADQLVRAGAPERAAWGIALGLTITLVWLYIEILRLLSYFSDN